MWTSKTRTCKTQTCKARPCKTQSSKSRFCFAYYDEIVSFFFLNWILRTNCNWRILFIFDNKSNALHVGFIRHSRILFTKEESCFQTKNETLDGQHAYIYAIYLHLRSTQVVKYFCVPNFAR